MNVLVIHLKDSSTDFLRIIYEDKDYTVITDNVSHTVLKDAIKSHDRIVMLGHGNEQGLFGRDRFIIDSSLVYLLRDKDCVCIWCNADVFVEKYDLKGFYTGMIISDLMEADLYCVQTTPEWIYHSNVDFAIAIRDSIESDQMLEKAIELYEGNTSVVEFNRNHLYYR